MELPKPSKKLYKSKAWKAASPVVFPGGIIDDDLSLTPDEIQILKHISPDAYRQTKHWKNIRAKLVKLSKRVCHGCWKRIPNNKIVNVHHLTYEHRGEERYEEVEVLCFPCHQKRHADEEWVTRSSSTTSPRLSGRSAGKSVLREQVVSPSYGPTAT